MVLALQDRANKNLTNAGIRTKFPLRFNFARAAGVRLMDITTILFNRSRKEDASGL